MSTIDHLGVNLDSQYVTWQENTGLSDADRSRILSGDLGQVQNITELEDGSFRVTTELGVLTLAGPELEAIRDDLTVNDYLQTGYKVDCMDPNVVVDMTAILKLLAQTQTQRRQIDRQVRQADRDMAMAEAYNAAAEIRQGALFNLIFGCVSGAINIGMGAMSAVGSFKSLQSMKTPMQDVKFANAEVKATQSEVNMRQAQVELVQARETQVAQQKVVDTKTVALNEANAKVQTANENVTKAQADVELQQKKVADLKKAEPLDTKAVQEAETELGVKQKALDTAKTQLSDAQKVQTTAQKDLDEAQGALQTAKDTVAQKEEAATKANKALLTEQENLVKQSQSAEKRSQGRMDKAQKEVDSLQKQVDSAKPGKAKDALTQKLDLAKTELADAKSELQTRTQIHEQAEANLKKLQAGDPLKPPENVKALLLDAQMRLGDVNSPASNTAQYRVAMANARYNAAVTTAQTRATYFQGIGQIGQGAAQIMESVGHTIEGTKQAASQEHQAQAERARTAGEDITADMQTATDIIRDVKECLDAIRQSNNQAFQAILQA